MSGKEFMYVGLAVIVGRFVYGLLEKYVFKSIGL